MPRLLRGIDVYTRVENAHVEQMFSLHLELGFTINWKVGGYVGFMSDGRRFILQRYENKEFAQNFMLSVKVNDVVAFRQGIVECDFCQDDLDRVFKQTYEKFGNIDIVVANAGGAATGAKLGAVADIGEADHDKAMDLNLKSVYFTVHKALPYMNDGGSIVMIGSNEAHIGLPALSLYGGAKAAIVAWARGFSLDLLTTTSSISSVLRWKTGGSVKDTSISLPASRIFHIAFLRT
jgi:hypothetical protein